MSKALCLKKKNELLFVTGFGLDGLSTQKIAVIDDGVMSIRFLRVFNQRIKKPFLGVEPDELAPFLPYLKSCTILVYISSNPEQRLSSADIVVNIRVSEQERLR